MLSLFKKYKSVSNKSLNGIEYNPIQPTDAIEDIWVKVKDTIKYIDIPEKKDENSSSWVEYYFNSLNLPEEKRNLNESAYLFFVNNKKKLFTTFYSSEVLSSRFYELIIFLLDTIPEKIFSPMSIIETKYDKFVERVKTRELYTSDFDKRMNELKTFRQLILVHYKSRKILGYGIIEEIKCYNTYYIIIYNLKKLMK